MPPPLFITITGCNPSHGSLILNDHGHTRAEQSDTIIWQIATPGVYEITSIKRKDGSDNIFSIEPYPQSPRQWRGEINEHAPECSVYIYSIIWKASATGPELTYDPIISIKPSGLHLDKHFKKGSLMTWIVSLLGLFAISGLFWQKKKSNK